MTRQFLFAVSLGLLLYAAPVNAALVSAELHVNGLSCPFCAFGIEKKLLDVEGVQGVEVFLDDGRIALSFKPDSQATVLDLERAVEKAGFEVANLEITVRGYLLDGEKGAVLLVANSRVRFRLLERRGENAEPSSITLRERLRGSTAQGGNFIVVAGTVRDRDEEEPTLVVDTGNDRIEVFDSSGKFLLGFGSRGDGLGEFRRPMDVELDAEGHVYVADFYNHRVVAFRSSRKTARQSHVGEESWGPAWPETDSDRFG